MLCRWTQSCVVLCLMYSTGHKLLTFYAKLPSTHSRECHTVEWGIPSADCGSIEGYAWTSAQYHVFRFGYKCENTMFIQTAKYRIALLPTRCPGTFVEQCGRSSSKMNANLGRRMSTLKNNEYEVIKKMEHKLNMLGLNQTNDRKHCRSTQTHE